jgi:hypothetical protein
MKKNTSIRLAFLVLVVSIVLPVNGSVKHLSSNRAAARCAAFLTGSPLPAPPPPGFSNSAVTGSPLPAPPPPGFSNSVATGSPLPAPPPPGFNISAVTGSPLPAPPPPGRLA